MGVVMLRVGYFGTCVKRDGAEPVRVSGREGSSSYIWKDLVRIIWNQCTTDLVEVKE